MPVILDAIELKMTSLQCQETLLYFGLMFSVIILIDLALVFQLILVDFLKKRIIGSRQLIPNEHKILHSICCMMHI